jgi:hypothetical protein
MNVTNIFAGLCFVSLIRDVPSTSRLAPLLVEAAYGNPTKKATPGLKVPFFEKRFTSLIELL